MLFAVPAMLFRMSLIIPAPECCSRKCDRYNRHDNICFDKRKSQYYLQRIGRERETESERENRNMQNKKKKKKLEMSVMQATDAPVIGKLTDVTAGLFPKTS